MATIQFQQVKRFSGDVDPDMIRYTDENGQLWLVPRGHRFWTNVYEPWLAAGNTPAAA